MATYRRIGEPPVSVLFAHERLIARPSLGSSVDVTELGALGAVNHVPVIVFEDADAPDELYAITETVYSVPFVSPMTVQV